MLNYKRNNEGLMLIYNLTAIKNSKIKICTQDESREKQRSSAKIMLIASELTLKGSLSEHQNLNKVSVATTRNRPQHIFNNKKHLKCS